MSEVTKVLQELTDVLATNRKLRGAAISGIMGLLSDDEDKMIFTALLAACKQIGERGE